jgi:hypothetical protein
MFCVKVRNWPCRREARSLAPSRGGHIEEENDYISGKDAEETALVEQAYGEPFGVPIRFEQLISYQVAAQHEKEIDAHPTVLTQDAESLRQGILKVVNHHSYDGAHSEGV